MKPRPHIICSDLTAHTIERHEIYAGRTTPQIEWRVWNPTHDTYVPFKVRRDALDYFKALCGDQ